MSIQRIVSRKYGRSLPGTRENGGEEMKDRKKQRENRRLKNKEELLDKRNGCGIKDLTAYNAVLQMKTGGKAAIVLR